MRGVCLISQQEHGSACSQLFFLDQKTKPWSKRGSQRFLWDCETKCSVFSVIPMTLRMTLLLSLLIPRPSLGEMTPLCVEGFSEKEGFLVHGSNPIKCTLHVRPPYCSINSFLPQRVQNLCVKGFHTDLFCLPVFPWPGYITQAPCSCVHSTSTGPDTPWCRFLPLRPITTFTVNIFSVLWGMWSLK